MDRLAVNAAIMQLLDDDLEDWETPASVIIRELIDLPPARMVTYEYQSVERKSTRFEGYTQESGTVPVSSEEKKEVEKSFGINKERIGYFRVWRSGKNSFSFHHFWKSNIATVGLDDEPPEFFLYYDPSSLAPIRFGYIVWDTLLKIGIFSLSKVRLVILQSLEGTQGKKKIGVKLSVDK